MVALEGVLQVMAKVKKYPKPIHKSGTVGKASLLLHSNQVEKVKLRR
jgi:hypothetical protein